jgi:magnesium-transporting ATPase (P-type)
MSNDKSFRLESKKFEAMLISNMKNEKKINISYDNIQNAKELNFTKKDIIELFVVNKGNYMTEVNKPKIRKMLLIFLLILAIFSITTTILAYQYYNEITKYIKLLDVDAKERDNIQNEINNFGILILSNIICTTVGILLLLFCLFYKNMNNTFVKILIYLIILGVAVINVMLNYYLTIYPPLNTDKRSNEEILSKYYYYLITYIINIPICLLILLLFYFYSKNK